MEHVIFNLTEDEKAALARFLVNEMGCDLSAGDKVRNPEKHNLRKVIFELLPGEITRATEKLTIVSAEEPEKPGEPPA